MPAMSETELKLLLPGVDSARIADLLARHPALRRRPRQVQQLHNVYYDTPDQRLRRQKVALRVRRQTSDEPPLEQWILTLKTAGVSVGGLSQRGEWEAALRNATPRLSALQGTPWSTLDPDGTLWPQLAPAFVTTCTRTLWLLRHRKLPLDIGAAVDAYRDGVQGLARLEGTLRGKLREGAFALEAGRLAAGVPEGLAERSVQWRLLHTGFDMIELSARTGHSTADVAAAYWHAFDELDLLWLWEGVGSLPRSTRWQTQARSALRDDLVAALADLAEDVLAAGGVPAWRSANERLVERTMAMFTDLRRVDAHDLTTLSVAVRQLRNLALLT